VRGFCNQCRRGKAPSAVGKISRRYEDPPGTAAKPSWQTACEDGVEGRRLGGSRVAVGQLGSRRRSLSQAVAVGVRECACRVKSGVKSK
jgi:hypothetical protein